MSTLEKLFGNNKAALLKHYDKTEEDLNNDIQYIKQWVDKQPHLPDVSELVIRVFLMRRKFSLERTKETIEILYRLKNLVPELLDNWDMSDPRNQQAFDACCYLPLPKLTPEFDAVGVLKLYDSDLNKFDAWDMARVSLMIGYIRVQVEFSIREHIIFDLSEFTIGHLTKLTPSFFKKGYTVLMKGLGLRVTAFHILNPPPMFDTILTILKPIMLPKLYNRIKIHNNVESLYKCIPKEILPKDYGGEERSMSELKSLWRKELDVQKDFLLKETQTKSDESKRINKQEDDIFGSMHGSFRTLQID